MSRLYELARQYNRMKPEKQEDDGNKVPYQPMSSRELGEFMAWQGATPEQAEHWFARQPGQKDVYEFLTGFNGFPPCVHFVGFRGDEFVRAQKVFGRPDFIHRVWDRRVMGDVAPGDTVVFAKGDETYRPSEFTFNDSEWVNGRDDGKPLDADDR